MPQPAGAREGKGAGGRRPRGKTLDNRPRRVFILAVKLIACSLGVTLLALSLVACKFPHPPPVPGPVQPPSPPNTER